MKASSPPRNRWPQRLAVAFCVATIAVLFAYSQSDVAFARKIEKSKGLLNFEPTAPAWIRERLGDELGNQLAVWFDTPTELFVGEDFSTDTLQRAAEIESLRWVVLDNRDIGDRQLALFKGHARLRVVRLSSTDITDQAFSTLDTLPRLSYVSLNLTEISPEALEAFRERHPRVEIEIDPVTASGIGPFVAAGRAGYRDQGVLGNPGGVLTLRGPLDGALVAAAKRLPFDALVLENVDATTKLVELVETRPIESVSMQGGTFDEPLARAMAKVGLKSISLTDGRLTLPVADALAGCPLQSIQLRRVALEPGSLATLTKAAELEAFRLAEMTLLNETLEPASVKFCELEDVHFDGITRVIGPTDVSYLSMKSVELDAGAMTNFARCVSRDMQLDAVVIGGESGEAWPAACSAKNMWFARMSLNRQEAAALAALTLESISLRDVEWLEGSAEAFVSPHVARLSIDEVSPKFAQALADASVEELFVSKAVEDRVVQELARASSLQGLSLRVHAPSAEDISALVALPKLKQLLLHVGPKNELPADFWQELTNRHPKVMLSVVADVRFANGVTTRIVWPQR